ncbi:MAG: protein phosphatase 2C domain-containing protein [Gemmatimonadaceae bacterium]|nr:protein phosphatase 2C domain-containing protein [Gemmatimonadaceae bacterium]
MQPPEEAPLTASAIGDAVAPTVTPAVDEAPPRAATWTERPPSTPWCPPALTAHVPELRDVAGADAISRLDIGMAGWRVVGASRRGRLHAHRAEHREDAMAQVAWKHGWVVAVADGAGSAPLSRLGAELAVRCVIDTLVTRTVHDPVRDVVAALSDATQRAIARVSRLATDAAIDPRHLRCTLLTAAVIRVDGREEGACAQVGDGVIATVSRDGVVRRVGEGDAGEYSGEVACFVPDPCAAARAAATCTRFDAAQCDAVLIASDGVEDPFYPIDRTGSALVQQLRDGVTAVLPGFQRQEPQPSVLSAAHPDRALLEWLRFEKRGENDDRTFVIAHRPMRAQSGP